MNKEKTAKGSIADKIDKEALESALVKDSNMSLTDLFLFSEQVDQLYSTVNEFDDLYPTETNLSIEAMTELEQ
tara:strand:- start:54 stop:272 length:219 start_codon:yes stop_codon:yes gene_type:complete